MGKYTFFYRGGKPKDAAEGALRQPKWDVWFRSMGDKLVDRGAPARSIGIAGSEPAFANLPPSTGYSVVAAASDADALKLARTCPTYAEGGVVEVARYVEPKPF